MDNQYSINFPGNDGSLYACDWGWLEGNPRWKMSVKETQWYDEGELTEAGRQELLKHFGLEAFVDELPIDVIQTMSPQKLESRRRELERCQPRLPRKELVSSVLGNHLGAELVA